MSDILLDTDIVIEILRQRGGPVCDRWDEVAASDHKLLYCPITAAELWHGVRPREESVTLEWLANLECRPITDEVGRLAGRYMQRFHASHGLQIGDALIAATASVYGCALWTRNRKHYPMRGITLI